MSTSTFKPFKGGKSKARKGLARAYPTASELPEETVLFQVDGEWGFYPEQVESLLATPADNKGEETAPVGESLETSTAPVGELEEDEADADTVAPVASGNMFSGIAATLETVASNPAPAATPAARAASRSTYTIEKDRPEQNGIKRPSAGGLCRAVWDAMDHIRDTTGAVPVSAQVRTLAGQENWNANNAMIEFYQWRKFNGITGRAAKPAKLVVDAVNEANAAVDAKQGEVAQVE